MANIYTPAIRALVVATLVVATVALLHVVVQTARAAGGHCSGYGGAYDSGSTGAMRRIAFGLPQTVRLRACDRVAAKHCAVRGHACDTTG
jgi:hypothetical protein